MLRFSSLLQIMVTAIIFTSCLQTKEAGQSSVLNTSAIPEPDIIIYQTTVDYHEYVPVTLSEDKKSIESYPGVKDIYYKGTLAYPTQLHGGYWLDNRGINKNVAFLKLTYKEYSLLPETPAASELMQLIFNDQPLKNMYSCGKRSKYKNIVRELNRRIDHGNFEGFTKVN